MLKCFLLSKQVREMQVNRTIENPLNMGIKRMKL